MEVEAINSFDIYPAESINFLVQNNEDKNNDINKLFKIFTEAGLYFKLALSFVNSANDIDNFREAVGIAEDNIISKIETQEGVLNIKEICTKSGAIMIGRGDLFLYSNGRNYIENITNIVMMLRYLFM